MGLEDEPAAAAHLAAAGTAVEAPGAAAGRPPAEGRLVGNLAAAAHLAAGPVAAVAPGAAAAWQLGRLVCNPAAAAHFLMVELDGRMVRVSDP